VITTTDGQPSGEFQAPREAFATTISTLPPDDYRATARLIDSAGTPRATPTPIAPFTLIAGSSLLIDLDFPADSFL
jgi:hypothetical protein